MAASLVFVGMVEAASAGPARGLGDGIVFQATTTHGVTQLFQVNSDGGGLRQITHLVVAGGRLGPEAPSWSPDRSRIIFDSGYRTPPSRAVGIFTIRPDGSELATVPLKTGRFITSPVYSPDGTKIAFAWAAASQQGIDVANANGTGMRRITEQFDKRPSWSPDGRWIAFVRYNDRNDAVFKVRADGTRTMRLTPWAIDASNPKWSPDGSKILFNTWVNSAPGKHANLFTIQPDGTGSVQLTHLAAGTAQAFVGSWSPDGRWIVYHRRNVDPSRGLNQLFLMAANGSGTRQLTHMQAGADPRSAAWAAD